MSYYNMEETKNRIEKIRKILQEKKLDAALIYYDEINIADGWYLTGWCPQFEKGAVLLPVNGDPLLLGGPESEPFAKMSSAITDTRCFSTFMVPDEEYPNATISTFETLAAEMAQRGLHFRRVGIVGTSYFPHALYTQFEQGFKGAELIDITNEYEALRYVKSPWEIENIRKAFSFTYASFEAMAAKVRPGATEIEIAAEGEYVSRKMNANGFAFACMVGSGSQSNAVVPTATNRVMQDGELVMLGLAPRYNGYAGVFGETLPVNGVYTQSQKDILNIIREAYRLTKDMIKPGNSGKEIDVPARKLYEKHGLFDYIVCPFMHTIGLMEAERPFFGPNSEDILVPGMTISIDISLFGHPEHHGLRIESGFVVTENGYESLSPEMDARLSAEL
ncbi:M24 family metallopeptidase [Caproiciproducens sp. R1]|uniref:M24 family metallopeptidase n=1 Tax=Caproiciproducens sp. R1 TaxID=3435000 RepID=UPI00056EA8AD|nr:aminopeptidase P family protein [Oscillospiraceae bacterium]